LLWKIRDVDLIAKEAHYHNTCRKIYTRVRESKDKDTSLDADVQGAYQKAFKFICDYVEKTVVTGGNATRITMLKEKYLKYMQENFAEHYNFSYKTDKLKDKDRIRFGSQITDVTLCTQERFLRDKQSRQHLNLLVRMDGS